MSNSIVVKAPAKVNITLYIRGMVGDYHDLESLMAKIDLFDVITITPRNDNEVTVTYSTGENYPRDNALKATTKIINNYGLNGVDVIIQKGVPEGVGLGGSAVDAAGIARGISELYGVSFSNDFLITLGGDVPFLANEYSSALVRGKGEKLTQVPLNARNALLIYGSERVSTAEVFAKYDQLMQERGVSGSKVGSLMAHNVLEGAAIEVNPRIKQYRDTLREAKFQNVVMTGSGAGFIAINFDESEFDDKVNRAIALCEQRGFCYKMITMGKN